jgi:phosphohistidine phosphatase
MKTLHLLRHAKSSWKDPGLDDHDRPLSKRGRETARAIAAYLRQAKIVPDLVICSTAVRARQTLDPIAKAIKQPKVILEREIYEVAQEKIWKHLWKLPESADCVLLIGHNPGLHDLALALADADLGELVPPRGGKFPTGAMASFRFDGAWKALRPHSAMLFSYTTPKAMKKEERKTAAKHPDKPVAALKRKTGKAAAAKQPAKQATKAKKPATKTTAGRTTKVSAEKAKPKRVIGARKAPPKLTIGAPSVASPRSAVTSIAPRPAASPAPTPVRPSALSTPLPPPAMLVAPGPEPAPAAAASSPAAPSKIGIKPSPT